MDYSEFGYFEEERKNRTHFTIEEITMLVDGIGALFECDCMNYSWECYCDMSDDSPQNILFRKVCDLLNG